MPSKLTKALSMALKIETLTRNFKRAAFDCGNNDLNRDLRNTARQHIGKGISPTFVLVEDSNPTDILGFFTLAHFIFLSILRILRCRDGK